MNCACGVGGRGAGHARPSIGVEDMDLFWSRLRVVGRMGLAWHPPFQRWKTVLRCYEAQSAIM